MKIVLAGGGSGGHFCTRLSPSLKPIEDICKERKLLEPELIYVGPPPFDRAALQEHDKVIYRPSPAGRVRRYASISEYIRCVQNLYRYHTLHQRCSLESIPTSSFLRVALLHFRRSSPRAILLIPVVIYDADAAPGRVSLWSAKFARFIALAHPDAASKFPAKVRAKICTHRPSHSPRNRRAFQRRRI